MFLAVIFFIILVAFTFKVIYFFLKSKKKNLSHAENKEFFGSLPSIMYLNHGSAIALLYPITFLMRRILLGLFCVFLHDQYALQVNLWIMTSLFMLCILARYDPFRVQWLSRVNFINEMFIFWAGILFIPMQNFHVADLDQKD